MRLSSRPAMDDLATVWWSCDSGCLSAAVSTAAAVRAAFATQTANQVLDPRSFRVRNISTSAAPAAASAPIFHFRSCSQLLLLLLLLSRCCRRVDYRSVES